MVNETERHMRLVVEERDKSGTNVLRRWHHGPDGHVVEVSLRSFGRLSKKVNPMGHHLGLTPADRHPLTVTAAVNRRSGVLFATRARSSSTRSSPSATPPPSPQIISRTRRTIHCRPSFLPSPAS